MVEPECMGVLDKFKINNIEKIIFYLSLILITFTVENIIHQEYIKIKDFMRIKLKKSDE